MTTQQRNYLLQVEELLRVCEEAEKYLPDEICESIEVCRIALINPPFEDDDQLELDEHGWPVIHKIETKVRLPNEELWNA
ncbi:hypothetical protein LCGC14_1982770 [marine sediment metagenome]|uniref:Uncharacterized protein n=1 Tax=marine sediment metagenome TaxID=412755 RepID=A0A0F9F8B3_9ZZZZ